MGSERVTFIRRFVEDPAMLAGSDATPCRYDDTAESCHSFETFDDPPSELYVCIECIHSLLMFMRFFYAHNTHNVKVGLCVEWNGVGSILGL